jgi:16S rRNA (cytidine1402-2'-O)-methyltransferase
MGVQLGQRHFVRYNIKLMSALYVVATPIGNLSDLSPRALETLGMVDYILSEDTRVFSHLASHFDIHTRLVSYHQHSGDGKKEEILLDLLSGKNIALVTDAGTPGVSDPGNELIDYLVSREPSIKIVPIPGPSSITTALSICGFRAGEFTFLGYAPKKGGEFFRQIEGAGRTIVFFESPYRILKMLDKLIEHFGEERRIFVGQELTKMHERYLRGSLKEVRELLEKEHESAGRVRGEIVCVLE